MLKKDKGITIISLVITVIILVVLGSIATYSEVSTVKESHFYNGVQQMKIMQSKVNELNQNKETDIGEKITENQKNTLDIEEIKNIIESKDRHKAGKTLPAHGLYLMNVNYKN